MSEKVCGYCGKANGWHVLHCPNAVMIGQQPTMLIRDESIVLIKTLPEVE